MQWRKHELLRCEYIGIFGSFAHQANVLLVSARPRIVLYDSSTIEEVLWKDHLLEHFLAHLA